MAKKISLNNTGCLLRLLHNKKNLLVRHKLDTETDKYYQTLNETVIPDCMGWVRDVPILSRRLKEVITYNTPAIFDGWNFATELVYRTMANPNHLTEKNLKKSRILRALMDMNYSALSIIDDFTKPYTYKNGKKTWASVCEGGQEAAIYDTFNIDYMTCYILQRHFRNDPGYSRMWELFSSIIGTAGVGHTLDHLCLTGDKNYDQALWERSVKYRAMKSMSIGGSIGLLHAGITDDDLIEKTMAVFEETGLLFQVWEDFMEYHIGTDKTGVGVPDTKINVNSWTYVTAMSLFNEEQISEFKEYFESTDPGQNAKMCILLAKVDLTGKYLEFLKNTRRNMENKIKALPDDKLRTAATSYMEWLLGETPDVLDNIDMLEFND